MVAAAPPPVQPGMLSTGISITIKYELLKDSEVSPAG
jgi:hypothetical protein